MILHRVGLLFILFLISYSAFSNPQKEEQKIAFLLNEISKSELVFIRNGKEYPAKKAAAHLKMKLNNAKNSWFTPDESKWTAEMFIDKVASKSSLSGKHYWIKLKNNEKVKSGDWLKSKLESFNE